MPKLPFMRFYPADYILATRALTDTEKAIWMDLLCYMWLKPEDRGRLDMHVEDMARLVGRDRLTLEVTLNALKVKGVCDLNHRSDQTIFVECRRMVRDQKQLRLTNKRVKRFNASINAGLTQTLTPKKTEDRRQIDTSSLKDKEEDISIADKPETDIQKIVRGWKMLAGIDQEDKAWDKVHFGRCARSAKSLLTLFGNLGDALDCMEYVYGYITSRKLDCTIETIVKRSDLFKERLAKREVV